MQYLETIPTSYFVISAISCLTFILYVLFKLFPKREIGIMPTLMKHIGKVFSRIGQELVEFYQWLFGTIIDTVDEYFINPTGLKVTGNLVIAIWATLAVMSIIISYNATLEWAIWMGINENIAYVFPYIIDLVLVASILQGVFYAKAGEKPWWPKMILMGYTLASVYANLDHLAGSSNSILAVSFGTLLAGIVAPVGILGCSEALTQTYLKLSLREGMHITDQEIKEHLKKSEAELAEYQETLANIKDYEARLIELKLEHGHMEQTLADLDAALASSAPNGMDRIKRVKTLEDQGLSIPEIAKELNIKEGTVRSYARSGQSSNGRG